MNGHEWLDYLVERKDPWLCNVKPLPGFNQAIVRVYAMNVLKGTWSLTEAHEALDAMIG